MGRYTCEAKSKSQWRCVRALPSHVEVLLLDQSQLSVVETVSALGFLSSCFL